MKALTTTLIAVLLLFGQQEAKADCYGPGHHQQFNRTLQYVAVQYSEHQKVAIILDYVRFECFTTQQLGTLLNQLNRDENRLQIAKDAFFYVSDPFNYNQLVFHMRSNFARVELRQFIAQNSRGPGVRRGDAYRPPQPNRGRGRGQGRGTYYPERPPRRNPAPVHRVMGDLQITQIIQTLENEPFNSNRERMAISIMNSQTALFTTAQVARIVRTLTFDSGKLDVAKAGYHLVIDPENYYLITNEFTFSSTKRALMNYMQ